LIAGGAAIGFYGFIRPSTNENGEVKTKPDFDIWYNPTYPNYTRLLNAIESLGVDVIAFRA
jgi:hypothetical protein